VPRAIPLEALLHTGEASGADGVPHVRPLQVLHHDEGPPQVFAIVEHADDVLVLDVACQARLVQEPGLGLGIGAGVRSKDLHHHRAIDDCIVRAIDVRHSAAKKLKQFILADGCWQFNAGHDRG
jgi:hypothetical protein